MMLTETLNLFLVPLLDIWRKFTEIIPDVLASLLFLLIGLSLARLFTTVANRVLSKIKLDDYTSRVGINEIFARVGLGRSPAAALAFVIYWSVLMVFLILAAKALGLEPVTELLKKFLYFVPKLIVAIIILFGGILLGKFLHSVVSSSATANNLKGGIALAKAANIAIIIFASLIAFEQLGISMYLVNTTLMIMLASLGLAFALAVGLGSKEAVAEYLREKLKK